MTLMEEQTRLAKWGNSRAVRIPSKLVKQLDLADNQDLAVTVKNGSIILTPIEKEPTNIHELFQNWQDDGKRDHELDWGESQGHELPW